MGRYSRENSSSSSRNIAITLLTDIKLAIQCGFVMVILSIASRVYCIIIIQVLPSLRKRQTIGSYNTSSLYHSQSHHAQRYTLLANQTNNESRHRKGSPMTLDHWSNSLHVHEWHGTRNYCKWQWLVVLCWVKNRVTLTSRGSFTSPPHNTSPHEWMGCVRIKCRFICSDCARAIKLHQIRVEAFIDRIKYDEARCRRRGIERMNCT